MVRGKAIEDMKRKVIGLTLSPLPFALSLVGGLLFALSYSASAQQPNKIPVVGSAGY